MGSVFPPGCTPRRQSAGGVSAPPKTGIAALVVSSLRRVLKTFFEYVTKRDERSRRNLRDTSCTMDQLWNCFVRSTQINGFQCENIVTFRHRRLLHPASPGAPSRREPRGAPLYLPLRSCSQRAAKGTTGGGKNGIRFCPYQCPQSGRFMKVAWLLLHVCKANASCACGALLSPGLHPRGRWHAERDGRSSLDTSCEMHRESTHFARRVQYAQFV